ncbi:hypothetical protein HY792_02755 [Candidatus Desantisbacteria bacterium]|nr:hypothetical protein [Candidatus Desantisbacteria bacterium]
MNMRKIGVLGLIAVMGMFWGCSFVEAAVDIVQTYKGYDETQGGVINQGSSFNDGNIVYVSVQDGVSKGGSYSATAIVGSNTVIFTIHDDGCDLGGSKDFVGNDGIYTGQFKISRTESTVSAPPAGSILQVGNRQIVTITADIDGIGFGTAQIIGEYGAPIFLTMPSISKEMFSPPGTVTISFEARDDVADGTWTYSITANKILIGNGTKTGTATVNFVWDGKGINGEQLSGNDYVIEVSIQDLAKNTSMATVAVTIENIPPEIISFYASDYYFSPGGAEPSTNIFFTAADNKGTWSYEITIDGQIPTGTGGATGSRADTSTISFEWNGGYQGGTFSEGYHVATLKVTDLANNVMIRLLGITIDNTMPAGTISENTSGLTKYLGEEIEFQITTNEPATATIFFTASEIQSAKEIITGEKSFRLEDIYWDQYEIKTGEVAGSVEVYVGNSSGGTWSTFVISDYDSPR